jgi:hypothetical protein
MSSHSWAGVARRVKAKAEVRSYTQAFRFLNDQLVRKLASNVWVVQYRNPDRMVIRLYQTDILVYYSDSLTFSADNGDTASLTTTYRLNQFGPPGWHFYHERFRLYGRYDSRSHDYTFPMSWDRRYRIANPYYWETDGLRDQTQIQNQSRIQPPVPMPEPSQWEEHLKHMPAQPKRRLILLDGENNE